MIYCTPFLTHQMIHWALGWKYCHPIYPIRIEMFPRRIKVKKLSGLCIDLQWLFCSLNVYATHAQGHLLKMVKDDSADHIALFPCLCNQHLWVVFFFLFFSSPLNSQKCICLCNEGLILCSIKPLSVHSSTERSHWQSDHILLWRSQPPDFSFKYILHYCMSIKGIPATISSTVYSSISYRSKHRCQNVWNTASYLYNVCDWSASQIMNFLSK